MRIVSGSLKGRRFSPPSNFKARPTTDFAKESLFNIISNHFDFEDIEVLDLFSGTGSISFEFASRGSRRIVLIENNPHHLRFIRGVISKLSIDYISSVRQDAFRFLKSTRDKFDIIFADPPYQMEGIERIPLMVASGNLLKNDGWLIVEHSKGIDLSMHKGYKETRSYGNVHFSIFTPQE